MIEHRSRSFQFKSFQDSRFCDFNTFSPQTAMLIAACIVERAKVKPKWGREVVHFQKLLANSVRLSMQQKNHTRSSSGHTLLRFLETRGIWKPTPTRRFPRMRWLVVHRCFSIFELKLYRNTAIKRLHVPLAGSPNRSLPKEGTTAARDQGDWWHFDLFNRNLAKYKFDQSSHRACQFWFPISMSAQNQHLGKSHPFHVCETFHELLLADVRWPSLDKRWPLTDETQTPFCEDS